jgi:hypothetical protein
MKSRRLQPTTFKEPKMIAIQVPPSVRLTRVLPILLALVAVVVPATASAQATRTWVSGVGDDANPCSRTAPCKTFAGAISKTANGGEINAIDSGGFGGVTINKSLTIDGTGVEAGVLVSGTNAIVVNALPTDKVKLKGLDINGIGTGRPTSLTGIKVLSAAVVNVKDSEIHRFKDGIAVVPTSPNTRVLLKNNNVHNNDIGVFNAPGSNSITSSTVTMRQNDIFDNTCGAVTNAFGSNGSTPSVDTSLCGTAASTSGINKPAVIRAYHNVITSNAIGLFAQGANARISIAYNEITGNPGFGLHRVAGAIIRTFTPGTNVVEDNGFDDRPNETVSLW